jgi:hypothetical protein
MRLKDVQITPKPKKGKTQIISGRVPLSYKLFAVRNRIDTRKLIMKAIEELMRQQKIGRTDSK